VELRVLDASTSAARLEDVGVPVARSAMAADVDAVAAAFEELDVDRVVLKAAGLVHKTDDGGVVLGLEDAASATAAARTMLERIGEQALPFQLQQQVGGAELLVGVRRDPQLGAALVVGQGGVTTEIHQDIARGLTPLDRDAARQLLQRLRIWPLLEGYRGSEGVDVGALLDAMVAVAGLADADPSIVELDLNPLLVGPPGEGVVCVDVRIVEGPPPPPTRTRGSYDLDRMLRPKHVAVVGVSDDEHKVGARLFRYLESHDFPGRLDPVHPAGGEIRGYTRYAALTDVEGSPDLVCVAVPARFVPDVARQCVEKQVGGVIVHSSDFAEVGESGRVLQEEVVRILAEGGIPLAGPNNMGIVAPHQQLTASISGGLEEELVAGNVGLVTSSGALGSCLATRLMGDDVGLSHWIHVGNEADLIMADYLEWLASDQDTRAVGLLIEDIKDGPRFIEAGRKLADAGKPMFAYNMIRSDKGKEAALSHTGAMVGSLALREEVISAAQMASVPSLRVLEDALHLSATTDFPAGKRLMVVTFSGGACSIIADECERFGVDLPELPEETRAEVAEHVPSFAAVRNPLDVSYQMLSAAGAFESALGALVNSGRFDALLVQFTTNADPYAEHVARATVAVREASPIPVYVSRFGGEHLAPKALAVYREHHVPVLDAPDRAAQAIAAVMNGRHPEGRR
jgi:acyl-CoA synthetase (NDP forming)